MMDNIRKIMINVKKYTRSECRVKTVTINPYHNNLYA